VSVQAVSFAIEADIDLPLRKLILVVIADHADRNGYCYPTSARIARLCACDAGTVRKHVAALIDARFLRRVRRLHRPEDGAFTGWLYQVPIAASDAMEPGFAFAPLGAMDGTIAPNSVQNPRSIAPSEARESSNRTSNSLSKEVTTTRGRGRARGGCRECGGSGWVTADRERNTVRACACTESTA